MSIRTERLARLVQREVADILQNELYEASQSVVTVTHVRVTNDLGIAYVYLSVLGDEAARRQIAFKRIDELAPQIRHALAQRVRHQVRRVPELRFFLDETQQQAQRIEELFAQIRAERDEQADEDAAASGGAASGDEAEREPDA
ncbi:MAG: 30S ribosome-binding factor RbfA [Rhodothermales bacterium]|nr:30S ribosome-binding factor RbfA [Rhodothermales bacterium]